jgi:hypothetical protein
MGGRPVLRSKGSMQHLLLIDDGENLVTQSCSVSVGRIGLPRLPPATARIVSTVFALLRRCGLFPRIEHRRPVAGCCCQGKFLRSLVGNIDYHVVLLRCSIQFLRLSNDSDLDKSSAPDLPP